MKGSDMLNKSTYCAKKVGPMRSTNEASDLTIIHATKSFDMS